MIEKILQKKIKKIAYQDHFITRLRSSTVGEGMLHEGNIFLMDYAIKNMPPADHVLEIGSWAGLSANLLLHLLKKYSRGEVFLSCDPWIYEGFEDHKGHKTNTIDGRTDISRLAFMEYIKQSFINSVTLFHKDKLPHSFRLTSDEFFKHYKDNATLTDIFDRPKKLSGKISFCYIDGNHAYEFAKRDFQNVSQYLVPNGMILLDDSSDGTQFGSAQLIKEIKQNTDFKILFKNPNYLIQKIK